MSNEMDMGRQTQGIYEQKAEKGLAVGKGVPPRETPEENCKAKKGNVACD